MNKSASNVRAISLLTGSLIVLSLAHAQAQTVLPMSDPPTVLEEKPRLEIAGANQGPSLEDRVQAGDAPAALDLANRLASEESAALALPYYRLAARDGLVEAQEKLALLLLIGSPPSSWREGRDWLERAVGGGSVRAMEELARIYLQGSHGAEQSPERALVLLERARVLPGAKEAFFLLGKMAAEGIGRDRDGAVAVSLLRRGEAAGSVDAILGLVDLFSSGTLVKKDLAQAEVLARKAFEMGRAEGAYRLAIIYEQAKKWGPAREWLERGRAEGHGGSIARLATYALMGQDGHVDLEKAYRLYREAAEAGNSDAAFAVAKLYQAGRGVPADPVATAAWLRLAAEGGQVRAQNEYGVRLLLGQGVTADATAAFTWLQKAAQKNLPAALMNLGELYLSGRGVEQDEAQALLLIERAARAGHADAQQRLARLCKAGTGTGADPVKAAFWADRAARQEKRFGELAALMRKDLSGAQRADLDRRLKE